MKAGGWRFKRKRLVQDGPPKPPVISRGYNNSTSRGYISPGNPLIYMAYKTPFFGNSWGLILWLWIFTLMHLLMFTLNGWLNHQASPSRMNWCHGKFLGTQVSDERFQPWPESLKLVHYTPSSLMERNLKNLQLQWNIPEFVNQLFSHVFSTNWRALYAKSCSPTRYVGTWPWFSNGT